MTPVLKRRRWFSLDKLWLIQSTRQGELCWWHVDRDGGRHRWTSQTTDAQSYKTKAEALVAIEHLRRIGY